MSPAGVITFEDRWLGRITETLSASTGDFVLKRADGFWAYQLAVVVDDGAQNITHIVRGADLTDSTARQLYLQECLALPTPQYLHVPVVNNPDGEKLSKQTGAIAFDRGDNDLLPEALMPAAGFLGLSLPSGILTTEQFWQAATAAWAAQYLGKL